MTDFKHPRCDIDWSLPKEDLLMCETTDEAHVVPNFSPPHAVPSFNNLAIVPKSSSYDDEGNGKIKTPRIYVKSIEDLVSDIGFGDGCRRKGIDDPSPGEATETTSKKNKDDGDLNCPLNISSMIKNSPQISDISMKTLINDEVSPDLLLADLNVTSWLPSSTFQTTRNNRGFNHNRRKVFQSKDKDDLEEDKALHIPQSNKEKIKVKATTNKAKKGKRSLSDLMNNEKEPEDVALRKKHIRREISGVAVKSSKKTNGANKTGPTRKRPLPRHIVGDKECEVCGRPASGYYYLAFTCFPCKNFFRRSMINQLKYECKGNQQCKIDDRPSPCSHCRLKRCLQVGMTGYCFANEDERSAKRQKMAEDSPTETDESRKLNKCLLSAANVSDSYDCAFIDQIATAYSQAFSHLSQNKELLDLVRREEVTKGKSNKTDDTDDHLWRRLVEVLKPSSICGALSFVIRIPGFSEFQDSDKRVLLRACVLDVLLLRMAIGYDASSDSFLLPSGRCLSYNFAREEGGGGALWPYLKDLFIMSQNFHRFKPDLGVLAEPLMAAYLAIRTDRPGIQNIGKVEMLEERILSTCLKYFSGITSGGTPVSFHKAILATNFITGLSSSKQAEKMFSPHFPAFLTKLIVHLVGGGGVTGEGDRDVTSEGDRDATAKLDATEFKMKLEKTGEGD